ncbi:hypothetical protein OG785_35045 [Streptomyces sp. NBC_00006]|uniref:hypothetical protein n=1 Tax=unclassified Streptomyces TaxID=2593676 RepID=UPI002252DA88|nr:MULTISPECIES: hypothetical protein [unclassified Streptomyces]MCX5535761.1 hypothetical protein [Streptomyces sp. NBC_00006]
MSDTHTPTDTTPTATVHVLHPMPAADPLPELSGAPAAVHAELLDRPAAATTAELALAVGLSRSTTGKALTTLESTGLATRERGTRNGTHRTPDRWLPSPSNPVDTTPSPTETITAGTSTSDPNTEDDAHSAPNETARPASTVDDATPAATATATHLNGPVVPAPTVPSSKARLAPGALHHLVTAHLQAHPEEAFTATKISRIIEKSSGAIANCLAKLTAQGVAVQVTERPRTYQLAPASPATTQK